MLIPNNTKITLIELDRVIKEFQIRKALIIETLLQVADIENEYKLIGQYEEVVPANETTLETQTPETTLIEE